MLWKLVIARHGMDDPDTRELHLFGRRQCQRIASALASVVGGRTWAVASSDAPRARQSAEILATAVRVTVQTFGEFYSERNARFDSGGCERGLGLLDGLDAEVVVLVTHEEWVRDLTKYLLRRLPTAEWPEFLRLGRPLEHGRAIVINLTEEPPTWQLLP